MKIVTDFSPSRSLRIKQLTISSGGLGASFSRPLKLRTHLVLLTTATLLPTIIFTAVIALFLARREQDTFKRGAIERMLALLTAIDTELKSSISTLEALGTSSLLDTGDLRAFRDRAERVLKSQPDWFDINLARPSGQQILNLLRPFGAELPMVHERSSFEQVLQTGKAAVGGVALDEGTQQHVFMVRVPVLRGGVIKYVLSAVVKPETFSALLAQQRLPPDWIGVVLDGNKRFVTRTMNLERSLGKPAPESLQAAIARAPEGWFRGTTIEGSDVYTAYNRSSFSDWTVVMSIPAAAVEASLRSSLLYVASLGSIFLALGIGLAWSFSSGIARSIGGLTRMAEDLGLGKGPPPTPPAAENSGPAHITEVEDVGNALVKANRLIRERSAERDRVEADLRQVSGRLELAQEAGKIGTFERDLITNEVKWSASQEKLYGLVPGGFGGKLKDWAERVHPDDLAAVEAEMRRATEDKSSLNLEFRIIRTDGVERWVASQAQVFADEDGTPRRLVGVNIDITERKRAEAAVKRLNEDLEKIVADRTADLMQANAELRENLEQREKLEQQLRHAQKMQAIGTLAGGIAHDFNNILGIIHGYAQEMYGSDPRDYSRSVEVIIGAAERGAKVVKQLLTFARTNDTEQKPVDINALVRDTLDILREVFPKTITFSIKLDPTLPVIEGDQNQLQQALINICLNARDAMPEGGTLCIRTSWVPASDIRERFPQLNGDYVQIDVSDTGTGMDDEIRQRVFEPFFTTKKEEGGTGLGLSVVYGIAQAHRGFIDTESERNRGTIFKLYLPIPSQTAQALEINASDGKAALSNGETLLIVEDEPHLLELVRISAEKRGFRVLTARDGEEALKIYHERWREIDVVLLDWGLPRLGGRAVFRKLNEINPQVKVIGISGYLNSDLKNSLLAEGVQDFLEKPCAPNKILEKVLSSCQHTNLR
jgi:two-component system, cell cycle sensor histidine kinase and response regulator CckA